jgi:predicted DNA-binding transcriptional regulator AlpA
MSPQAPTEPTGLVIEEPGDDDQPGVDQPGVDQPGVDQPGVGQPFVDEPGADIIQGVFEPALSLKELAAELNVAIQALYDLRSQGRGPAGFRVGRCLRFRRSVIQAWLERLEREDAERHCRDGA